MTKITIVSTYTALGGQGKFDLGDCGDLRDVSVQDVKFRIELLSNLMLQQQSLWWRGYLLDDNNKSVKDSCVGVNPGETVDETIESLVLFLTVPLIKYSSSQPDTNNNNNNNQGPVARMRSPSFDLLWAKHERSGQQAAANSKSKSNSTSSSQSNCSVMSIM